MNHHRRAIHRSPRRSGREPSTLVSAVACGRASRSASRRSGWVLAAITLTACSGGDDGAPAPPAVDSPGAIAITERAVWGPGRAVSATARSNGELLVQTTQGIYRSRVGGGPDEAAPTVDDTISPATAGPIATSPDGAWWAVATTSPISIELHDGTTGAVVATHTLPVQAPIRRLRFIEGDRLLAETPAGPFVADLTQPRSPPTPVLGVAASARSAVLGDGTVVTGSVGTREFAVATRTSIERHTLDLPIGETVIDVESSPDGAALAVTAGIGPDLIDRVDRVVILDAASLAVRAEIDTGVALQPDQWVVTDDAIVIASGSGPKAWDLDGSPIELPTPVESAVSSLAVLGSGWLTVHDDGTVVRWSRAASDGVGTTVLRTGTPLSSLTVSDTQGMLAAVDLAGAITVHDATDGAVLQADDRFADGELTALAVAADGTIAVTSSLGEITLLDRSLAPIRTMAVTDRPSVVSAVAFSPTDGTVAAGVAERVGPTAFDDTVRAWAASDGGERFRVGGEREDVAGCSVFVSRVRFSPDGRFVAITSHDFSVIVVDAATGDEVHRISGETTVLDVAYSPDGAQLVASYDDGMVVVWSTASYELETSFRGAQGGYQAIALVHGGDAIAAADLMGSVTLLDIDDGEQLATFADGTARTTSLVVSPDGALLAAPTSSGGVTVWSTVDGAQLGTAGGHNGPVTDVGFAPDSAWIATSSTDGTVRSWTLATTE